jgi:hypothetical protein
LAIRLRDGGTLIGTAALLVPHPPAGCPWVGLLIIHCDWQSRGSALAIEEALAEEGWSEVRLSVLKTNADALPFWDRLGYRIIDERDDTTGRPCWVLAKEPPSRRGAPQGDATPRRRRGQRHVSLVVCAVSEKGARQ